MASDHTGDGRNVADERRLRFYGEGDIASYMQVDRAVETLRFFISGRRPGSIADAIELHNARRFFEAGFTPRTLTADDIAELAEASARVPSELGRYFARIDAANAAEIIRHVPFEYRTDLIELLASNHVYDRCPADLMLRILSTEGVHLSDMLGNKKLVKTYDPQVREVILREPRNAEIVIRHYFSRDRRKDLYLPSSLSPRDARDLMSRYVQAPDANPNYLRLIQTAQISPATGVDARLKLEAKRRNALETEAIFKDNPGIKAGAEVSIAEEQDEPSVNSLDGMVTIHSYSRSWMEQTTDFASVLNNFQHLFGFADHDVILTLPSYRAELGVIERFIMMGGATDYHVGAAFRNKETSSLLQTHLARGFLEGEGIELELAIQWFFEDYLPEEFEAKGFRFSPSAKESSFLEKTRHLLVEMESVVRQFERFVEDGEIDRELLSMTSDAVRYRQVPSRVEIKYLYPLEPSPLPGILEALFSDQSSMGYINEELRAENLVELLVRNEVEYEQFEEFQRPTLDMLLDAGVLALRERRVQLASVAQFKILRALFVTEAASYAHQSELGRQRADEMIQRGWLRFESTLLTRAEASYFNYQLNKYEFSNGPELRNKYLHGAQTDAEGADAHFRAYLAALKLTIALVIKINDDFRTADEDR
ncbi:hypothetical protein NS234_02470 [Microbacterium oxydans]|uniref:hypothetical protein n=1 Tax=Microbacterium oxydans TaxID=82380 RepID=UPI0007343F0C|nr:hypothetical protein [Microbacterium oxydans]KTR78692.1 hypothetical protein NS234_02470 [Microbacterium oxydans]